MFKKRTKIVTIATLLAIFSIITACESRQEGNKTTINEPDKPLTIIDNADKDTSKPDTSKPDTSKPDTSKPDTSKSLIKVSNVEKYENMEISDWLDDTRVIVSKENTFFDKLSLLELSDSHPRSLYLFNTNTKEYQLLKEQREVFLGGATLSADKKHLLYYEYTLGDPSFYIMNMDTLESFGIWGETIGGAMSAHWADNDTVIGTSYNQGIYLASTTGEIKVLEDLKDESFYIVRKIKDTIYYNTINNDSLIMYNLLTKEKVSLEMNNVYDVIPSPKLNQILILQANDSKISLILCDLNGENKKIIAEGSEINGVSWSPDERFIAYNQKEEAGNNTTVTNLSIYDTLISKSSKIAVDIPNMVTNWSPSSDKLIYIEMVGTKYNSSIVSLEVSMP